MRITPLKPLIVIRTLKRMGFDAIRQKGSHIYFRHPDGRSTVVPYHAGDGIPVGIIKEILRQTETDWETFKNYAR